MRRVIRPTLTGSIPTTIRNHISIARYAFPVLHLRLLGIALLAAAGFLAIFHGKLRRDNALHPIEERVAAHLGLVVVPVDALALPAGAATTPVHDFMGLATLARYLERPILQTHGTAGSVYAVDDEARVFEFRAPLRGSMAMAATRAAQVPSARRARRSTPSIVIASGVVALLMVVTIVTSFTASNIVPTTYIGKSTQARTLAQLLPAQCSGLAPTKLITTTSATTSVTGSNSSELILGPNHRGTVVFNAGGGDDCIVAGGDSRTTNQVNGGGGAGTVCIGAPTAHNTFTNCPKHYN
ncbi:unannotated protein [freshwater metagenome]|uniref:Unannotated protein n=1 Tax=freshwater metagenome TaxID=449393 RepID=A0A6J6NP79_9ZZZZ